jgi:hypothetical protein
MLQFNPFHSIRVGTSISLFVFWRWFPIPDILTPHVLSEWMVEVWCLKGCSCLVYIVVELWFVFRSDCKVFVYVSCWWKVVRCYILYYSYYYYYIFIHIHIFYIILFLV